MATMLKGVPAPGTGARALPAGPVLSLRETAALMAAPRKDPRRPPGTMVTVHSYSIPRKNGFPRMPAAVEDLYPDHMYVDLDDGREHLIARGGPNAMAGAALADEWVVTGEVGPAHESRDFGRSERVLQRTFVPGLSAQEAAEAARRRSAQLARDRVRYGTHANSNSFAADVAEEITGHRPGDRRTWGYRQPLETAPRVRPEPLDLSPALRGPPY